jgi:Nucleotidyl transferase of unknown function (DUF2204)
MLDRDFREFAELLAANGVEALLVGSYALAAHGHPRYSGDIDFWVRRTPENIARLLDALVDFGFGSMGLKPEDFDADKVIQLGHPPRRIDLLTALDGVDFDTCWADREQVDIGGVTLQVIGRADLVANKRAAGRPQDLADLAALGESASDGRLG